MLNPPLRNKSEPLPRNCLTLKYQEKHCLTVGFQGAVKSVVIEKIDQLLKGTILQPAIHGAVGYDKKLYASVTVPPFLCWFLANGHLPRVSRQSCMCASDNGDNEIIPGLFTGLLAFTLQLKFSSARRALMKTVRPVVSSNGVP